MKHLKALVVKAIMIWAIVWIILSLLYDVAFIDSTMVGVLIVMALYVLGDLVILRKFGNIAATIADAGVAAVILWLFLSMRDYNDDLLMLVLIPTVLIGVGEFFFHKWLWKERIVPDESKDNTVR